ncbi:MAG: MMPL family transporter [Proteobacteria bacterium]|nr:MMPL family transporter [Pseudomonadota bacterium]
MKIDSLLQFGADHKLKTIFFLICATAALSTGLPKLYIDTSFTLLLNHNSAQHEAYQSDVETFGSDDLTVFLLKDPLLFTPEKLETAQNLVDDIESLEFVQKVDSLFSVTSVRDVDGTFLSKPPIDFLPFDQYEADQMKEDALYSPILRDTLVNDIGTVMSINVTLKKWRKGGLGMPGSVSPRTSNKAFEGLIKKYQQHFAETFQIGESRIASAMEGRLVDDLKTLSSIALFLLLALVLLFLKRWTFVLVIACTVTISLIWTFGFLGLVGIPVSILMAMLPVLLVVIGSTEDLHLLSAYLEGCQNTDSKLRSGAIRFMAKHMSLAVILTVITTSAGFFSNTLSELPIIAHFAAAAAFGIIANAVITFLVVPLLLSLINSDVPTFGIPKKNKPEISPALKWITTICTKWLVEKSLQNSRVIMVSVGMLGILTAALSERIEINNDPLSFFSDSHSLVNDFNEAHASLAGVWNFRVTIDAYRKDAYLEPENLERLSEAVQVLNSRPSLDRAISLSDHLSLVNREMHGGNQTFHRTPTTKDLTEQYLLFFNRSDLQDFVSNDYRRASIFVRHNITNSEFLLAEIEQLETTITHIFGPGFSVNFSGQNLMIHEAAETLVKNEIRAVAVIILVAFLLLWIVYGSWRSGFLVLVPSVTPILLIFLSMALLDVQLNIATAMIAAISIGVAVDDTIHLLSRYNILCHQSEDSDRAIRETLNAEAIPVITSSLVLAVGFLVLTTSDFSLLQDFGLLGALAMLFAMLAEFTISPVLIRRFRVVNLWDALTLTIPLKQLQDSPIFFSMSRFQIRKLILLMVSQKNNSGDVIVEEGSQGSEMFIIINGRATVTKGHQTGFETLSELGVGDVIGEIGYLNRGKRRRTASVIASTDIELLRLSSDVTAERLRFYPRIASQFNFNIARILGDRLGTTNELLTS